ncbi:MAG: universal stress protein [Aestuariivirgaceae bacterium]
MYSKILAPVDLAYPDTAKKMVAVAKALADTGKSTITVLNVIPDLPGYVAAELPTSITDKIHSDAIANLKTIASELSLTDSCDLLLRSGRPHSQILQAADEIDADLIVIASHQPGLEDYLLGSVAGKVVRHAKCSVLVERSAAK